ncbi:MAG: glycosyl transferase [Rhodoferax sp.]|nr:glycosyl transferase [Rhodoferax sp.]
MSHKRVLLYVQHLLGIGHLKRAATLADAMTSIGLEVTLVSGGAVVPGMALHAKRVVQLPPASAADLSFKTLIDAHGVPVDEAWKQNRRDLLLDTWRETDPHALVTELFPFGRRQMRFELLPLLDAAVGAPHRPVIVSSVRDVLGGGQKDPARQDRMLELFEAYFDQLLVHGDPSLISFDQTFTQAARISAKLHYTGYVVDRAPPADHRSSAGRGEVIVSVGGGAVGRMLLETAILARQLSSLAAHHWRLLVGSHVPDAELADIAAFAQATDSTGGITVERNRSDFPVLLANCCLSVSQGGYNTVMDILRAGARAVVVPFAGGAEVEQTLRARLLAERGWIDMVKEAQLTPHSLAAVIDRAVQRAPPAASTVLLDGAENSADLLAQWTSELAW